MLIFGQHKYIINTESTGMLARGRKKSYILAMSFMALFYPTVRNKKDSADALFILQKFLPDFWSGGPWLYNSAHA